MERWEGVERSLRALELARRGQSYDEVDVLSGRVGRIIEHVQSTPPGFERERDVMSAIVHVLELEMGADDTGEDTPGWRLARLE